MRDKAGATPPTGRDWLQEIHELTGRLRASEALLDRTGRVAGVGGWELSLDDGQILWTSETCRIHEVEPGHRPSLDEAIGYYAEAARAAIRAAIRHAIETGEGWDLELPMTTARGRRIWVRSQGMAEKRDGGHVHLAGAFQDITERRQAIDSLMASERRFRKMFIYSLGLICTHDMQGRLLTINPSACESLGYFDVDLIGRPLTDCMPEEDHPAFAAYLERVASRGSDAGRLRFIAQDGTHRVWQYQNVVDEEDGQTYVLGHAQDITEQQLHEKRLKDWSIRDELTGCFNRRFLAQQFEHSGENTSWACIAIDLDRFKLINDTYGHQRGDEVLVEMARFLSSHLGDRDYLIRMGGDEFLVLLKDQTLGDALRLAAVFEAHRTDAANAFSLGCSGHIPGQPVEATWSAADKTLYATRAERRLHAG